MCRHPLVSTSVRGAAFRHVSHLQPSANLNPLLSYASVTSRRHTAHLSQVPAQQRPPTSRRPTQPGMLERQQPDSSSRTALAQPPDSIGTCSAAFPGADSSQQHHRQQPQPSQPSPGSFRRHVHHKSLNSHMMHLRCRLTSSIIPSPPHHCQDASQCAVLGNACVARSLT